MDLKRRREQYLDSEKRRKGERGRKRGRKRERKKEERMKNGK